MDPANNCPYRRKLIRSGCETYQDGTCELVVELPFTSISKMFDHDPTTAEWIAFLLEVRDRCVKQHMDWYLAKFGTSKEELMRDFEFTIQTMMIEDLKSKL